MEIGMSREHSNEDHTVGVDGDDLGDSGVGVFVAHDEIVTGLRFDPFREIIDMGVRQSVGVYPVEVHPEVPCHRAVYVHQVWASRSLTNRFRLTRCSAASRTSLR